MLTAEIETCDRHVLQTLEDMLPDRCPTWDELARQAGITSSEVRRSMQRLNLLGYVSWNPCLPRSFVLISSFYEEFAQ